MDVAGTIRLTMVMMVMMVDENHDDTYFSVPHVCLLCGRARSGRLCSALLRRAEERRHLVFEVQV